MQQTDFVNMEQTGKNERVVNNDRREWRNVPGNRIGSEWRPRRRSPWMGLTMGIMALVIIALLFVLTHGFQYGSLQKTLPARAFSLTGHGSLVVDDSSGSVHVHTGNAAQVIVQGNEYANGFGSTLDGLQVQYGQDGNTVTISVKENWNFVGNSGVNFDITVPTSIDVNVQSSSGDVTIDNVAGPIRASSSSGDIQTRNTNGPLELSTSSGSISMTNEQGSVSAHTSSGDINIEQLVGPIDLSSSSGSITLKQAQVSGQDHIQTASGEIDFSGTLDPQGSFQAHSSSGSITLKLPAASSFQLTTSTDSGDVSNAFAGTTVGSAPHTVVDLETNSGDIRIQQQ